MAAEYGKLSPYYGTEQFGTFLDIMKPRTVPKNKSDTLFRINAVYQYRPDLLANDLYGKSSLWWVFSMRNPNVLQDPIFDFVVGKVIYVPNGPVLFAALGI